MSISLIILLLNEMRIFDTFMKFLCALLFILLISMMKNECRNNEEKGEVRYDNIDN